LGAGKAMTKRKIIFPIIILTLFLSVALVQPTSAESPKNSEKMVTIWMPKITSEDYFVQITVTNEQIQTYYDKLYAIYETVNISTAQESQMGSEITQEEWDDIKSSLNDFIISIKTIDETFPNINTKQLVTDVIDAFFNPLAGFFPPNPVISIGTGATWIPLYNYESFIGYMFRPMLTRYFFGFSKVGGLLSTYLKIGTYFKLVLGFKGLFINFGDIGFDQIIGPTIYIGRALFVRT
jgi:hypothetical protein